MVGKKTDGYISVEKTSTDSGVDVEVYSNEEDFLIVFPQERTIGSYIHAKFDDLDFLKLFVEDLFFADDNIEWS